MTKEQYEKEQREWVESLKRQIKNKKITDISLSTPKKDNRNG